MYYIMDYRSWLPPEPSTEPGRGQKAGTIYAERRREREERSRIYACEIQQHHSVYAPIKKI